MNAKLEWLMQNCREGEEYSGLILGKNGEPDYHLFLRPYSASNVTFEQAQEFAKKVGGDLPTRRELSLLIANAKEHFQPDEYWSGEHHAADAAYAWYQSFGYGTQVCGGIGCRCRARAVRRVFI